MDEPQETVKIQLGKLPDGVQHGTPGDATITITDNDATTAVLTTPDTQATKGDPSDRAEMVQTLGRGLEKGETLAIPLAFAGASRGDDFSLALEGTPAGVSLSGSTVTFTGPETGASAATATVLLTALAKADAGSVTVSIPTGSDSGATILDIRNLGGGAIGSREGSGAIALVDDNTEPSTPLTVAFTSAARTVTFATGETEKEVRIPTRDDSHDDDGEIFIVRLSDARSDGPVKIADGEGIATIENSDPLPAAFLARFGRTVAEQALDGIAGRMDTPRTAGMKGALAGHHRVAGMRVPQIVKAHIL